MKTDEYGFPLVDLDQCVNDDPFVLASQVEQVFYVLDPIDRGWYAVRNYSTCKVRMMKTM